MLKPGGIYLFVEHVAAKGINLNLLAFGNTFGRILNYVLNLEVGGYALL